jgi:hypothetical protein
MTNSSRQGARLVAQVHRSLSRRSLSGLCISLNASHAALTSALASSRLLALPNGSTGYVHLNVPDPDARRPLAGEPSLLRSLNIV